MVYDTPKRSTHSNLHIQFELSSCPGPSSLNLSLSITLIMPGITPASFIYKCSVDHTSSLLLFDLIYTGSDVVLTPFCRRTFHEYEYKRHNLFTVP